MLIIAVSGAGETGNQGKSPLGVIAWTAELKCICSRQGGEKKPPSLPIAPLRTLSPEVGA